jgi:hypothetical protein
MNARKLKLPLWIFLLATILLMGLLSTGKTPLVTGEAPNAVISLELAASAPQASAIIGSWVERERLPLAARQIQLDFAFIAAYTGLAVLLALWQRLMLPAAQRNWGRVATLAIGAALLAGALDVVENFSMLDQFARYLERSSLEGATQRTFWAAAVKFVLIGTSSLLILALDIRRLGGTDA